MVSVRRLRTIVSTFTAAKHGVVTSTSFVRPATKSKMTPAGETA